MSNYSRSVYSGETFRLSCLEDTYYFERIDMKKGDAFLNNWMFFQPYKHLLNFMFSKWPDVLKDEKLRNRIDNIIDADAIYTYDTDPDIRDAIFSYTEMIYDMVGKLKEGETLFDRIPDERNVNDVAMHMANDIVGYSYSDPLGLADNFLKQITVFTEEELIDQIREVYIWRHDYALLDEEIVQNSTLDVRKQALGNTYLEYLINLLSERLALEAKILNLPSNMYTSDYWVESILLFDEKMLLERFSFVLKMSEDLVNKFLVRAFRREKLDYYNPDEFLIALVLKNKDKKFYENEEWFKRYHTWEMVKSYYAGESQTTGIDNPRNGLRNTNQLARLLVKTGYTNSKLVTKDMDKLQEGAKKAIDQHKKLLATAKPRTIQNIFDRVTNELRKSYSYEINTDALNDSDSSENNADNSSIREDIDKYPEVTVCLAPDQDDPVRLPGDVRFVTDTGNVFKPMKIFTYLTIFKPYASDDSGKHLVGADIAIDFLKNKNGRIFTKLDGATNNPSPILAGVGDINRVEDSKGQAIEGICCSNRHVYYAEVDTTIRRKPSKVEDFLNFIFSHDRHSIKDMKDEWRDMIPLEKDMFDDIYKYTPHRRRNALLFLAYLQCIYDISCGEKIKFVDEHFKSKLLDIVDGTRYSPYDDSFYMDQFYLYILKDYYDAYKTGEIDHGFHPGAFIYKE